MIGRSPGYNFAVIAPLGLIAGEGIFPLLVARGALAAGRSVICAGLAGCAWPELRDECSIFRRVGVLRMSQWINLLHSQGCREAIMVGRVAKAKMYSRWRYFQYIPDTRTAKLWFNTLRHDKSAPAILRAVSDELAREGITLIDSTRYCTEHLAQAGVMTRHQPTEKQWQDIRYGWDVCRTISRMGIGQAIAVLDKDVIAVEALEGTNAMIDRAGYLCKTGGWTLIKVANSGEDMRLDVPSIGTTTLEKLHASGAACVVLEPGKTIILEKQKVLELADRYKITIVGFDR